MRLDIDYAGLRKVLDEPDARNAVQRIATDIVQEGKASGPRNPRHTSHVIDLLTVGELREDEDGAVQDIDWPSPVWHLVEWGSVNNAPAAPVRRAVENLNLKVIERGK